MTPEYMLLILGMGAVTFGPRLFPVLFLPGRKLPVWFAQWLDLIPVAILGALLVPELVVTGAPRHLDILNVKFAVAVPTLLFALKTRSLGGTIILGMGLYWCAGFFINGAVL